MSSRTARRSGPGSGTPASRRSSGGCSDSVRSRQAMATAWATNEGPTVNCLKPFVIPDMWYESDPTTQDVNDNHYMDPNYLGTGNSRTASLEV